jgi:prefoldin alpha subunit
VTEEEVRQMVALLERYRGQMEMLAEQLGMLQGSEAELGAASELLGRYDGFKDGDELLVPVGGGVFVPARLTTAKSVVAAVGSGVHVELPPGEAAARVSKRRERIREMISQTRATIEQIDASASALSAQLEDSYRELEASGRPLP